MTIFESPTKLSIMRIIKNPLFYLIVSLLLISLACTCEKEAEPVRIGISKALPDQYYGNYARWLKTADSTIICVDLYHIPTDSALILLDQCSGLLISGGPDVYPGRYGREGDTVKCGSIDLFRDTLEFALIEKAKEMQLPVLGICRGLQIFNIYHGGSLFAHIPTDLDSTIKHRCPNTYECYHEIRIKDETGLHDISNISQGIVNSNHHQGIWRIGNGLCIMARSNDGLIEAIEYENPDEMPFFMGVQWHPERMDPQSPLSLPIAKHFLAEARQFKNKH